MKVPQSALEAFELPHARASVGKFVTGTPERKGSGLRRGQSCRRTPHSSLGRGAEGTEGARRSEGTDLSWQDWQSRDSGIPHREWSRLSELNR